MKTRFLMILGVLFPVWVAAQVTVDFNAKRQTMIANGINMEGYHVGQWDELSADKKEMLETLPCQVARIGAPMVEWERSNDNDDPDVINWDGFSKDDIAVIGAIERKFFLVCIPAVENTEFCIEACRIRVNRGKERAVFQNRLERYRRRSNFGV